MPSIFQKYCSKICRCNCAPIEKVQLWYLNVFARIYGGDATGHGGAKDGVRAGMGINAKNFSEIDKN